MEIIDAHAHIYPEKIAKKATETIGEFYDIKMELPAGTPEQLLEDGKKANISRYIVHSCATKKQQVRSINEFVNKEVNNHSEFVGFMTLHQDMTEEEISNEVDWCIANGFKGIKLHPDFQRFNIDSEDAKKIYRVVGDRLPILFHTGDRRYEYSQPARLVKMAKEFNNVNFIGAHFGGYMYWDNADIYKGLDNVYFDTCSSLMFITSEQANKIIDKLGYEKFFFGTDFPMWDAVGEIERFERLNLSNSVKEHIYAKNIKNLLNFK